MDVALKLLDDWVLDSVWAKLVPLRLPLDSLDGALAPRAAAATASFLAKSARAVPTAASASASEWIDASGLAQEGWTTVSAWARDDIRRQIISLIVCTYIGSMLLYVFVSGFSYYVLFDHRMMEHPRFLKNQVMREIKCSCSAIPWLSLLMLPWFLADVRGHTPMYARIEDGPWGGGWKGWAYLAFSAGVFLVFTDWAIYWIHRLEHHPSVYRFLHKRHHQWVVPTPWSAYAFHPIDGYLQSLPYHIASHFLLPLNKYLFLGLFFFVNLWTIAIHDSDMIVDHPLEKIINGPAHHTLHHMQFNVNYGQYFTWSDRAGGSYRHPSKEDDPLLEILARKAAREQTAAADGKLKVN